LRLQGHRDYRPRARRQLLAPALRSSSDRLDVENRSRVAARAHMLGGDARAFRCGVDRPGESLAIFVEA
jgi:hypothetical protein